MTEPFNFKCLMLFSDLGMNNELDLSMLCFHIVEGYFGKENGGVNVELSKEKVSI